MASASTFHNAAGPDDASWKGFMLQSGSPEPPPVPRGPPLRYDLTTVNADRSSNVFDGVKLNGPLTTARLREASSTANRAAQGVYVFTSLAEAQDETDPGFDAAYPAASEFCRKCGKSTTVDGLPVVGEEALVSAVTEAMYDRINGHGHHMERPTGYSVAQSDPKAWPFLTAFDDPKVYAMRELHALCEAHFMHPMDDSDARCDGLGFSAPFPPPLPIETGGYVFRWEALPGKSEADKLEQ
eukprot:jgi/Tetstr1/448812/TSEL_036046.t1